MFNRHRNGLKTNLTEKNCGFVISCVRFQVLAAASVKMTAFGVTEPLKSRSAPTRLQGAISQNDIFVFSSFSVHRI